MSHTVTPTGSRRPEFDTLAERLWWARETAPLTQTEIAARLGISVRTVQNYESGSQAPAESRLVLWANACDVDAVWLAGDFYSRPLVGAVGGRPRISRVKTQSSGQCMRSTRIRTVHRAIACDPLAA